MKKQFNAVINGKGGVGKSFFAVNFIQYLKDREITHVAVDSDNENSTLKRFHPEVTFLDLEDAAEIDSIFATLNKTDLVVMDCRAASTDIFLNYFEEVRIFDLLKEVGASLNFIMPVMEQFRNGFLGGNNGFKRSADCGFPHRASPRVSPKPAETHRLPPPLENGLSPSGSGSLHLSALPNRVRPLPARRLLSLRSVPRRRIRRTQAAS